MCIRDRSSPTCSVFIYLILHNIIKIVVRDAKVNSNGKRSLMVLYVDVRVNIRVFKLLNDTEIYSLCYAVANSINFSTQIQVF